MHKGLGIMVAVVGAGNWGKNLVRNFYELDALTAVAEANPGLRSVVADQYPGITTFSDYRDLLKTDISAVAVATPASTHYEVVRDLLLAGKDVFVEKPMTLSSRDADSLAQLAREQDRILMVGHLLLYQPAIQYIKTYLNSGFLGQVFSLHQQRLNLGRARSVENALWSLGVHDIAVLLYLVGQAPCWVQASGQQAMQSGIEDDVHLHMEFPNRIQAYMHMSWLWPEKQRKLTIVGSQGMLVYDEADQTVMLHRKGIAPNLENWDDGQELIYRGDSQPLRIELEHFLSCLDDRRTPLSSGDSGVEVVRVLEESAALLEERCRGLMFMNPHA